jgi:hypothetical protein
MNPEPHFHPIPTAVAEALRAGGRDAYGLPPERAVSDGAGVPCRHCLRHVPAGQAYLIAALRPFAGLNPYTETGPVFLCAAPCAAPAPAPAIPAILASPAYILRGYGPDERIVYGTGGVVQTADLPARAAALLADPRVAFADVRSAANNCYQVRLRPAAG